MNEAMFRREKLYQGTMIMVRNMRKNGLITADEYTLIDTIMLVKYAPTLGNLFSENPLT